MEIIVVVVVVVVVVERVATAVCTAEALPERILAADLHAHFRLDSNVQFESSGPNQQP